MVRASSLQALNTLSVNREIDSKYDAVLAVRDKLTEIELVAGIDVEALLAELEAAQDFTGISVVAGDHTSWDPVNKVITVQSVKGDKGDTGAQGPQGIQGLSIVGPKGDQGATGAKGDMGAQGPRGFTGETGATGPKGADGQDLTVDQIVYEGNGVFVWQFSDGTSYTTPSLMGPKGDTGLQGVKGDQGVSVHHIKGTSTTNPNGDFGTSPFRDTYTVYGDASETINLGHFVVANGVSDGMSMAVYDTNGNGIVDNSERLGGVLAADVFAEIDSKYSSSGGTIHGDVTITGDLVVNGDQIVVNTETVTTEDNLLLINAGEVGAGVTKGEAGIEVDRGTAENYKFVFVETDESFKVGVDSNLQKVATREDTPINNGVAIWDSANFRFNTTRDINVDSLNFGGNGQMSWNSTESTLDVVLNGATLQVGQEQLVRVRNTTGSTILNGRAVMATGSTGNSGRINIAPANITSTNSRYFLGVVTEDIAAGADGFCTTFGKIRAIQTNGANYGESWVDGDVLYIKDSGNGALTKVVPTDIQVKLPVAMVINSHASNGTIFIRANVMDENHSKADLVLKAPLNNPVFTSHISIGGATLSSWSSLKVMEASGGTFFGSNGISAITGSNAWYDGTWKYKVDGSAGLQLVNQGSHQFRVADAGLAGNAITWVTTANIDKTGFSSTSGTATVPGYGFLADLDTGIYNPSANKLGFVTGGIEQGSIDSSGNLVITGTISSNGVVIGTLAEFTVALG